jgi:hypothetical protein
VILWLYAAGSILVASCNDWQILLQQQIHTVSLPTAQPTLVLYCLQVLRATPQGRRDRTAVDTLRALCRLRVWFFQTLPFVMDEFPDLPCWKWAVFK